MSTSDRVNGYHPKRSLQGVLTRTRDEARASRDQWIKAVVQHVNNSLLDLVADLNQRAHESLKDALSCGAMGDGIVLAGLTEADAERFQAIPDEIVAARCEIHALQEKIEGLEREQLALNQKGTLKALKSKPHHTRAFVRSLRELEANAADPHRAFNDDLSL